MKKYLLLFFVIFASVLSLSAQDDTSVENAVITIKTNKAVDTEITIEGYTLSATDAITVDWGDGVEKNYFTANFWNTFTKATGNLKGETVKISGKLKSLEIKDAGVTAAQWKFSGDKHKSLQVYTERTFHQRYLLVML